MSTSIVNYIRPLHWHDIKDSMRENIYCASLLKSSSYASQCNSPCGTHSLHLSPNPRKDSPLSLSLTTTNNVKANTIDPQCPAQRTWHAQSVIHHEQPIMRYPAITTVTLPKIKPYNPQHTTSNQPQKHNPQACSAPSPKRHFRKVRAVRLRNNVRYPPPYIAIVSGLIQES